MIHVARGLDLPLDVVTQTIGVLARKRAGKSYTARRFSEQLLKASQQVVIVDPKGDHWGIRSAADGKRPGLPVVIVGGEHGGSYSIEMERRIDDAEAILMGGRSGPNGELPYDQYCVDPLTPRTDGGGAKEPPKP